MEALLNSISFWVWEIVFILVMMLLVYTKSTKMAMTEQREGKKYECIIKFNLENGAVVEVKLYSNYKYRDLEEIICCSCGRLEETWNAYIYKNHENETTIMKNQVTSIVLSVNKL